MQNPDLFVHVSRPSGIHRVPRAIAERGGWEPLAETEPKRPRSRKPRVDLGAATPTPESEADVVSVDPEESE